MRGSLKTTLAGVASALLLTTRCSGGRLNTFEAARSRWSEGQGATAARLLKRKRTTPSSSRSRRASSTASTRATRSALRLDVSLQARHGADRTRAGRRCRHPSASESPGAACSSGLGSTARGLSTSRSTRARAQRFFRRVRRAPRAFEVEAGGRGIEIGGLSGATRGGRAESLCTHARARLARQQRLRRAASSSSRPDFPTA